MSKHLGACWGWSDQAIRAGKQAGVQWRLPVPRNLEKVAHAPCTPKGAGVTATFLWSCPPALESQFRGFDFWTECPPTVPYMLRLSQVKLLIPTTANKTTPQPRPSTF